jgi:PAS domain-containing protein
MSPDKSNAGVEAGGTDWENLPTGKLLRALVDLTHAGVVVADAKGNVLMTNDVARDILGGCATGNLTDPQESFLPYRLAGSPMPAGEMPLARALQGGEPILGLKILIRRADESERIILAGRRRCEMRVERLSPV